ncbi:hypothetical protein L7F22_029332, partial [Adiantum nelumboides]|nr:hypothetical protein [Adiantum nelumboides]
MVDRDDACMGVMFEGMDQMVEKIKEILLEEVNCEAMFEEMNVYIQARWLMMDSPLHATAVLLNPKWFPKAPHKDAENSFGESGALEDMEHLSLVGELWGRCSSTSRLGNKAVVSSCECFCKKEPAYVLGPCKSWDVEEVDDEENAIEEEMEAVIGDIESM